MPDDLASLAVDEGPGAFVPRVELASADAIVRLHARGTSDSAFSFEAAKPEPADPKKKARRRAARAARRRNRA